MNAPAVYRRHDARAVGRPDSSILTAGQKVDMLITARFNILLY